MRACDTPSLTQNVSLGVQSPDPSCRRTKVEGERRNKQADCANLCVCLREVCVCVCVWGAGGVFVCVHVYSEVCIWGGYVQQCSFESAL